MDQKKFRIWTLLTQCIYEKSFKFCKILLPKKWSFLFRISSVNVTKSEETNTGQLFSCEFCEISKMISFTEDLWVTTSVAFALVKKIFLFFFQTGQAVVNSL